MTWRSCGDALVRTGGTGAGTGRRAGQRRAGHRPTQRRLLVPALRLAAPGRRVPGAARQRDNIRVLENCGEVTLRADGAQWQAVAGGQALAQAGCADRRDRHRHHGDAAIPLAAPADHPRPDHPTARGAHLQRVARCTVPRGLHRPGAGRRAQHRRHVCCQRGRSRAASQ